MISALFKFQLSCVKQDDDAFVSLACNLQSELALRMIGVTVRAHRANIGARKSVIWLYLSFPGSGLSTHVQSKQSMRKQIANIGKERRLHTVCRLASKCFDALKDEYPCLRGLARTL